MNVTEIEKMVISYIEQSINGLDKENPKFDFKSKWYDLSSKQGLNEFVKDTSSIVNTVGPDGFIVIGFDEKNKTFHSSTFKDSMLNDSHEVMHIIQRRVDRLFQVNTIDIEVLGNKISVIHIPPSLDKPHVIRLYQSFDRDGQIKKEEENKIFVRKNTGTYPASKYDIELMYYDRKNITPDYELRCNYHPLATVFYFNPTNLFQMTTHLTIENIGRRPAAITAIELSIEFENDNPKEIIELKTDRSLIAHNIIIKANEIWNQQIIFISDKKYNFPDTYSKNMKQQFYIQERQNMKNSGLTISLANGTNIYSELE